MRQKALLLLYILLTNILCRKGTTYTINVSPSARNNNVGRVGCQGCNPIEGDTDCAQLLPILCISKLNLNRPWYEIAKGQESQNGWSGGIYTVTPIYQGTQIKSKSLANHICRRTFSYARIATTQEARYFENMNDDPPIVYPRWNFQKLKSSKKGKENAWGVILTNLTTRFWVWSNDGGNCAHPQQIINHSKPKRKLRNDNLKQQFNQNSQKYNLQNINLDNLKEDELKKPVFYQNWIRRIPRYLPKRTMTPQQAIQKKNLIQKIRERFRRKAKIV